VAIGFFGELAVGDTKYADAAAMHDDFKVDAGLCRVPSPQTRSSAAALSAAAEAFRFPDCYA